MRAYKKQTKTREGGKKKKGDTSTYGRTIQLKNLKKSRTFGPLRISQKK